MEIITGMHRDLAKKRCSMKWCPSPISFEYVPWWAAYFTLVTLKEAAAAGRGRQAALPPTP